MHKLSEKRLIPGRTTQLGSTRVQSTHFVLRRARVGYAFAYLCRKPRNVVILSQELNHIWHDQISVDVRKVGPPMHANQHLEKHRTGQRKIQVFGMLLEVQVG